MAAEGEFPKVDGDILFASETNVMYDKGFETAAQNRYAIIYDGDVTNFNTLQTDEWVTGFEVLTSAGNVDTGNTTMQHDSLTGYFTATLLDDFEDNSIDATIWTTSVSGGTASVTESGGELIITGDKFTNGSNARATTNGSTGLDFKTEDSTAIIRVNMQGGNPADISRISVTNGSTFVTIREDTFNGLIEIYFDTVAETIRTRTRTSKNSNWSIWSSNIDISSVTTNWYLDFYASEGADSGGTSSVRLADFWFVKGAVTQVIQSNGYDHIQTSTDPDGVITLDNGFFTVNKDFNGATQTWSLSTNDGANFSSATENTITSISNPSNQLVLKGSIQSTADRPAYIYEFGVKAWS